MAACSHSEAEAPLIPTVSFSRNSSGRRSARLRVRALGLRPEPHPPGFPIRCTKQRRVPRRPPPEAETANFPPCRRSAHKRKQGLAGAMRQASQYHIIFVFRPGPCDLPRERQFLQQSTEPDHKSDFLWGSQQRPQRSAAASRTASARVCGGAVCSKYCSNTALTSILMRPARPS